MDPIVCLFSPRLLQGQDGEDALTFPGILQLPHQPSSLALPSFPPFYPFTPLSPLLNHLSIGSKVPEALLPPLPHALAS